MNKMEMQEKTSGNFKVRLELRVKNAELIRAREEIGWTQTEAAQKIGISQTALGSYETLRAYPGEEIQDKICEFYGLAKEEIFPEELRYVATINQPKKFITEKYIPKEKLISLTNVNKKLLPHYTIEEEISKKELPALIDKTLIELLTPRQSEIVKLRFGMERSHPHTLEEIANMLRITRERVRNIEMKAMRTLQYYAKSFFHQYKTEDLQNVLELLIEVNKNFPSDREYHLEKKSKKIMLNYATHNFREKATDLLILYFGLRDPPKTLTRIYNISELNPYKILPQLFEASISNFKKAIKFKKLYEDLSLFA